MSPKITVITPTRNRANTIHRVFESLNKQTFLNFEWLVCDDASNDNTINKLKKFKKKSKFDIRIFKYKKRAGKPKIDNFCVKKAKGEFVIFADSDDAFKKKSFSDFLKEWKNIPKDKKNKIFAIISRITLANGKSLEPKLNIKNKSISLINLWHNHKKKGEKWLFIKKKILLKYKFPEIDFYVPEGITWEKISLKYNVWILDKCYRIFYSDTQNSVTHSKKINYPIGQLKSLELNIKMQKKNNINDFRCIVNYFRFRFINNYYFNYNILDKFTSNKWFFFKILGFLLFLKDIIFLNLNSEKYEKNNSKPIEIN